MTTGISNIIDFAHSKAVGGRAVIRLLNSSCGWFQEVTGRTTIAFQNCVLDTGALSKNFLKPLDEAIYVVNGLKGVQNLAIDFKTAFMTDTTAFYNAKAL